MNERCIRNKKKISVDRSVQSIEELVKVWMWWNMQSVTWMSGKNSLYKSNAREMDKCIFIYTELLILNSLKTKWKMIKAFYSYEFRTSKGFFLENCNDKTSKIVKFWAVQAQLCFICLCNLWKVLVCQFTDNCDADNCWKETCKISSWVIVFQMMSDCLVDKTSISS